MVGMNISTKNRLWLAHYRMLILGFFIGLVILSMSRILLFIWQFDRVSAAGDIADMLLMGLRADIVQMGYLTLPMMLIAPLFLHRRMVSWWVNIQSAWLLIALSYILFMEAATPAFILQYDVRPNRLFIEYLAYPREVFSTLWAGFKAWVMLTVIVLASFVYVLVQFIRRLTRHGHSRHDQTVSALLIWPLLLLALLLGVRSTLAHRPANPAFFAITADALVNSLVINSAYSVEHALYNMRHEADAARIYGNMPIDQILTLVKGEAHLSGKQFPYEHYPTVHFNTASRSYAKPKNIVIILEESLGATFVNDLGGIDVTPNLDQLRHQGWWFKQLYATGTRSVRGIEAVVSSFLPTPARSTVKLSLSQTQFYTAADLLSRQGYFTEFLYGGETHFDNMASFFSGNGFQSIRGQSAIDNPRFVGSWGASDQDLLEAAHQHFEELSESEQPFFSLVFTSSNHEPFEFPDQTISYYSEQKQCVENAVKYADFALGEFFAQAMNSSYWDDTLFLVVADHDTRVYGNELVPINKFHIPGLILGGSIDAKEISTITSQIDLLPTVISLAGVSAWTPAIGQDLSMPDAVPANRAMMQFGNNYAWMTARGTAILTPNTAISGHYDPIQKRFIAEPELNSALHQQALAHALLPSWLYQQRAYFVPVATQTSQ